MNDSIKVFVGDIAYKFPDISGSNFVDHLIQIADGMRDIIPLGEPMSENVYCRIPSAWGGITILSPNIAKALFFDDSKEWEIVIPFHKHEDWIVYKNANSSIYVVGDFDYYLAFAG